jgi:hypothetical protein
LQPTSRPGGASRASHVDQPAVENRRAVHVLALQRERKARAPGCRAHGIGLGDGGDPRLACLGQRHRDRGTRKQLQAPLHDGLEHRLHVGRQAADDAQDLGGRRLLLQRLPGLVEQRMPDPITAWSAKVCSSLTCFSGNCPTSARQTAIEPMTCPSRSIGTAMLLR